MIKVRKDTVYAYNNKEKALIFLFPNDKNDFLCEIKGWFGERLYTLLKSKGRFKASDW